VGDPALGTRGQAGHGCGEVETGPAAALLGQGLAALGSEMGSWATGRVGAAPGDGGGTVRANSALRT